MILLESETAEKLKASQSNLENLESENEELFNKATAAEEEADAATGKVLAASNEVKELRKQLEEREKEIEEITAARSKASAEVSTHAALIHGIHTRTSSSDCQKDMFPSLDTAWSYQVILFLACK